MRTRERSRFGSSILALCIAVVGVICFQSFAHAQALEGRITEAINQLVRIVNILIAGFIVWAGFSIARGEESGLKRLIYGIIGLVVVNAAYLIINYFR